MISIPPTTSKEPTRPDVVIAQELFSGSRLMDLATPDDAYRNDSIRETQARDRYHPIVASSSPKPDAGMIVSNIGGFTMDEPLPAGVIEGYYRRFANNLDELDREGVEIIPQTMAPFPGTSAASATKTSS